MSFEGLSLGLVVLLYPVHHQDHDTQGVDYRVKKFLLGTVSRVEG